MEEIVKNMKRLVTSFGLFLLGIIIGMEIASHSNSSVHAQPVDNCEQYFQSALHPEYSNEMVMRHSMLYLACREHQR
jgi:hypothetical protein